ncbi:MAG TPA: HesA/MoeB/ThiF family protein [Dissulfurispiraceae bacterium]|nr:HesA/MoeB/ThiF family protein [Dissulfurispiraceae bacterium]
MDEIKAFLSARAAGAIAHQDLLDETSRQFGISPRDAEGYALSAGLLPARYQRNLNTLSIRQQLALFNARIAVIGCGGLGGYVIEELARLGIGNIVAVDPDRFEEHNMNRQLLCTLETLDRQKAVVAAERVLKINPAISVTPITEAFKCGNASSMLNGCDLAVDALDTISVRIELAKVCAELKMPLVHGAIAGWFGQIAVQLPGEHTVLNILERCGERQGIEKETGNPSFAPAFVASLQSAEVCKIIIDKTSPMKGRLLFIDLFEMRFEEMHVG